MLHNKVTAKISELQTNFGSTQLEPSNILQTFRGMKLSESFSEFNHMKKAGYSFKEVLSLLIWMIIHSGNSVNSSLPALFDRGITLGKDVYYRFKNSEQICWRRILWYIAGKFLSETGRDEAKNLAAGEGKKKYRCLIFDDTLLEKTGKKIEKIGFVFDHVEKRMVLGFKLLVGLYYDGVSAIPLDFSLSRERGRREDKPFGLRKKDLRRQFSKKRMKESESENRVNELDISKIELAIRIFLRTVYHCIPVDYVLCDSWFTCEALLTTVHKANCHLIGMYKNVKTKFEYRGRQMSYKEILHLCGKEKRCKKMHLWYKKAQVHYNGEPVTLFFSKAGCKGEWKVILTDDTTLQFIQLIEIYQIRWSIEVFFKETKQLLNLGGCQSSNFDAQIAETTITMIAYILLACRYRYENYASMGALFRAMNAEDLRKTLDIRLWEVFVELLHTVCEVLEKDINDLLLLMMHNPKAAELIEKMLSPDLKAAS
jgi:DNA-directed RNA polymerase subunit M/transcription elongation factor TFIIS